MRAHGRGRRLDSFLLLGQMLSNDAPAPGKPAPGYALLLAARVAAGFFGGVRGYEWCGWLAAGLSFFARWWVGKLRTAEGERPR